jgi:hypothetical protein
MRALSIALDLEARKRPAGAERVPVDVALARPYARSVAEQVEAIEREAAAANAGRPVSVSSPLVHEALVVAAAQGYPVSAGRLAHECHWLEARGAEAVLCACERAGLARRLRNKRGEWSWAFDLARVPEAIEGRCPRCGEPGDPCASSLCARTTPATARRRRRVET